jgi:hypothetical protein
MSRVKLTAWQHFEIGAALLDNLDNAGPGHAVGAEVAAVAAAHFAAATAIRTMFPDSETARVPR